MLKAKPWVHSFPEMNISFKLLCIEYIFIFSNMQGRYAANNIFKHTAYTATMLNSKRISRGNINEILVRSAKDCYCYYSPRTKKKFDLSRLPREVPTINSTMYIFTCLVSSSASFFNSWFSLMLLFKHLAIDHLSGS